MKWLQWSKSNLETGLGGVEEHARCVARELRRAGVDAQFSSDPADLRDPKWDVIHTHGGNLARVKTRAIHAHTLHGTTLGRMAACNEWLWARGYLAEAREALAVLRADVLFSVHPDLSLFQAAQKRRKPSVVCGNGWDAGEEKPADRNPVPETILAKIDRSKPIWLYVGRGDDIVKGADRVRAHLRVNPGLQLIAVPGTGFEGEAAVLKTGRLDSSQVRSLFEIATGMLAPSRYEGNSLVVLEALASGLAVVTTDVGGVPNFPREIQGLEVLTSVSPSEIGEAITKSNARFAEPSLKSRRGEANRSLLPRWRDVTRLMIDTVNRVRPR